MGHLSLHLPDTDTAERMVAVADPPRLFGGEGMIPGAVLSYTAAACEQGSVVLDGSVLSSILRTSQQALTAHLKVREH